MRLIGGGWRCIVCGVQKIAPARAVIAHERPRSIIGTPPRVAERMLALQASFEADEVIVLSVAASYAARLRTYELLAQAFGLDRADSHERADAA